MDGLTPIEQRLAGQWLSKSAGGICHEHRRSVSGAGSRRGQAWRRGWLRRRRQEHLHRRRKEGNRDVRIPLEIEFPVGVATYREAQGHRTE